MWIVSSSRVALFPFLLFVPSSFADPFSSFPSFIFTVHLDYDLSPDRHPLIWTVLAEARSQPAFHLPSLSSSSLPTTSSNPSQPSPKHRTLTLGHMTHLSLFTPAQLSLLETKTRGLDVTFVALPTSDLYMMGRDASSWRERGRGSFDIWELEGRGMKVLMGLKWVVSSFFFRFVESD